MTKIQKLHIITKISKIDIQNELIGNNFKTVFYCKSANDNDRMCVIWGRTTFKEGDEITMTGRMSGDVFIVWKHLYSSVNLKEA